MQPNAFIVRFLTAPEHGQGGETIMNQPTKKDGNEQQKQMRRINPIDENLRRAYEETAGEPLPDRIVELLARLREQK